MRYGRLLLPGLLALTIVSCGGVTPSSWLQDRPRIIPGDFDPPSTDGTDTAAQQRADGMARGFRGAYLVAQDGKVLAKGANGAADRDSGEGNTVETRFRLASLSKPLTAIAIMQLHDQGRLNIDDSVKTYLPDWGTDQLKIRHLLSHRSGLADYVDHDIQPRDSAELYQLLKRMGPGRPSGFSYCNTNFSLLGIIIERVTGVSYESYMQQEVFGRAKAAHSGLLYAEGGAPGFAAPEGSRLNDFGDTSRKAFAAGGLYSTVEDWYFVNHALHSAALMSQTAVSTMLASQPGGSYGLGWYVYDGYASHDGVITGFNTKIYSYPASKGIVIVLSNEEGGAGSLASALRDLLH